MSFAESKNALIMLYNFGNVLCHEGTTLKCYQGFPSQRFIGSLGGNQKEKEEKGKTQNFLH